MANQTIGFIRWSVFLRRPRERRAERSYYHGSKKPALVKNVENGGTLWLVTTDPRRSPRPYRLACRLVACEKVENPPPDIVEEWGEHVVHATVWNDSYHYPYDERFEDVFWSLRFADETSFSAYSRKGMSAKLYSYPVLDARSGIELEGYGDRLISERRVFLSYAREDSDQARLIESELSARGVRAFRDESALLTGDEWERELEKAARSSDAVLILLSRAAAESEYVRKEIGWALDSYRRTGLVKRILPLLLEEVASTLFQELRAFQWRQYAELANAELLDDLADVVQRLPRYRSALWSEIAREAT